MKKFILFFVTIVLFSAMFSGCFLFDDRNFDELAIGERFGGNRDGCAYKLNDSVLLLKDFHDDVNDLVGIVDFDNHYEDTINGAETLLEGKFQECYCDNHYIILVTVNSKDIVTIECDNNYKYQYYDDLSDIPIQLTELTHISFR